MAAAANRRARCGGPPSIERRLPCEEGVSSAAVGTARVWRGGIALGAAALAAAAVATVHGQPSNAFRASRDHPAIAYSTGPVDNAVVDLNRQVREGAVELTFDGESGYLRSVLEALDIPVESQVAVFSPTSNRAPLITSTNPRAIYFRDDVAVAWVRGSDELELAVQDRRQGSVFYTLAQTPAAAPQLERDDQCLACHLTWDSLGVPGLQVLSTFPLTSDPNAYATGFTSDHRARIEDRWGGWYVTGRHEPFVHMGNVEVTDVDDPQATIGVPRPELPSLAGLFDATGYLTPHSDMAALMVLEHQAHMTNLITQVGWEARRILYREAAGGAPAGDGAAELLRESIVYLVDYLLFVDEAPLARPIEGSAGFAAAFAARGSARQPGAVAAGARPRPAPDALPVQLHDLHAGVRRAAAAGEGGHLPAPVGRSRGPRDGRRLRPPGARRPRGDRRDPHRHEARPARLLPAPESVNMSRPAARGRQRSLPGL